MRRATAPRFRAAALPWRLNIVSLPPFECGSDHLILGGKAFGFEMADVFPFFRLPLDENRHGMFLFTENLGRAFNHFASAGDDDSGGFGIMV
jgi:hypothetical protein